VLQKKLFCTNFSGTAENTKKKKSDSEKGHRRMFDEELDKYETYGELFFSQNWFIGSILLLLF